MRRMIGISASFLMWLLLPCALPQSLACPFFANTNGAQRENRQSPDLPLAKTSSVSLAALLQIKPVQVHHLVPSRHEGTDELLLRIRTCVDLGEGAQL